MKKPTFLKFLASSLFLSLGMLFIWLILNNIFDGNVWKGMKISSSAEKIEYCEFNNTSKFFHQSSNTYSNLAYFFFGVLLLQIAKFDTKINQNTQKTKLENFPLLSALMGFCFIYLSFGSAFFHASLTYLGQRVDMNGTYSVSITLLGIGLFHLISNKTISSKSQKLWIGFLLLVIIAFWKIHLMISSRLLLPIMILLLLLTIAIHYFKHKKEKSLLLAILGFVLMLVAVKIRTLDVQKWNCNPESIYQGHAVWHLLTALSSFCSYAFFRFNKFNLK